MLQEQGANIYPRREFCRQQIQAADLAMQASLGEWRNPLSKKSFSRRLLATLPTLEPFGQRADFAQAGKPVIDGVVIAPHHIVQGTIGDAGFDVMTIQPEVALHVETVCAAGHRTLGIDHAGAGSLVKQRADDGTRPLANQDGHLPTDFPKAIRRQRGQTFLQQAPFRRRQSRHFGEPPTTTVAALPARPVAVSPLDGPYARFDIEMQRRQHGHDKDVPVYVLHKAKTLANVEITCFASSKPGPTGIYVDEKNRADLDLARSR
jgi:hypothetical protein